MITGHMRDAGLKEKTMRKITRNYQWGESIVVEGFLWFPKSANVTIDGESYTITRWLERAKWVETAHYGMGGDVWWSVERWLDLDD